MDPLRNLTNGIIDALDERNKPIAERVDELIAKHKKSIELLEQLRHQHRSEREVRMDIAWQTTHFHRWEGLARREKAIEARVDRQIEERKSQS